MRNGQYFIKEHKPSRYFSPFLCMKSYRRQNFLTHILYKGDGYKVYVHYFQGTSPYPCEVSVDQVSGLVATTCPNYRMDSLTRGPAAVLLTCHVPSPPQAKLVESEALLALFFLSPEVLELDHWGPFWPLLWLSLMFSLVLVSLTILLEPVAGIAHSLGPEDARTQEEQDEQALQGEQMFGFLFCHQIWEEVGCWTCDRSLCPRRQLFSSC